MLRVLLIGGLVAGAFWGAMVASAHGTISRTEPADGSRLTQSPPKIQAWFDEPIQPASGQLTVINQRNERMDVGATRHDPNDPTHIEVDLKPNLPPGAYVVSGSGVLVSDGDTAVGGAVFWIIEAEDKALGRVIDTRSAAPQYGVLVGLLGALLIVGVGGYVFFSRRPLAVVHPEQAPPTFPLE